MDCPHCGAKNSEEATFCRLCAKRLMNSEFASSPTPAQLPPKSPRKFGLLPVLAGALLLIGLGGWYAYRPTEVHQSRVVQPTGDSEMKPVAAPAPVQVSAPSDGASVAPADTAIDKAANAIAQPKRVAPVGKMTTPLAKKAANLAAAKRDQPKELDQSPTGEPPVALLPEPETPPPPQPKAEPAPPGLAAELQECAAKGLLAATFCKEQVRWRHCSGKWGTDPDCPKPQDINQGGG